VPVQFDPIIYATHDGLMPAGNPKIQNYQLAIAKLIRKARGYYNLKILTICSFSPKDQAQAFATDSWNAVCQEAQKNYHPEDSV
jgi:hypothetical protein